jgi:hypothetical protein
MITKRLYFLHKNDYEVTFIIHLDKADMVANKVQITYWMGDFYDKTEYMCIYKARSLWVRLKKEGYKVMEDE